MNKKADSNTIEASKPLDVADDNVDILQESKDEYSFDSDDCTVSTNCQSIIIND